MIHRSFWSLFLALFLVACGGNSSSDPAQKEAGTEADTLARKVEPASEPEPVPLTFDFEKASPGELPGGWSQHHTGEGKTRWEVMGTMGEHVLAQLHKNNPSDHFNLAVYDDLRAQDLTLSVRLHGVSGKHDQGGGLIWRYQDPGNHYIVRANPLENNVVLYKMEDSVRTDLPLVGKGKTYGVKTDTLGLAWHTLKVKVKGPRFTVFLDEEQRFEVEDSSFLQAGKVGLWTKADAVTWFDDLKVVKE